MSTELDRFVTGLSTTPFAACSPTRASTFRSSRNATSWRRTEMSIETIEQDFHRKVSQKIRLSGEGIDRYRVFTPFLFDDGDHLAIVLKKDGMRWVLSDEAHTYMHLTYGIEEKDLHRGPRQKIISNALSTFGIEDQEGELVLEVPEERYGDALFSFVQGLLKITDVSFLSRERVRSTFMEDFRAPVERSDPRGAPELRLERPGARSQRDVHRGLPDQRDAPAALRSRPRG